MHAAIESKQSDPAAALHLLEDYQIGFDKLVTGSPSLSLSLLRLISSMLARMLTL